MLNIPNLMAAIGRVGRTAYVINGQQSLQGATFAELAGFAYLNPEWFAQLSLSYDGLIRAETAPMQSWVQAATAILLGMVSAQDPVAGSSLPSALTYVYNAFVAQAKTVQSCTIGKTVTPDAGNVGTGAVFVTLQRGDGLIQQNTIAESSTLAITSDSYTGGATAGQEPWTWRGAPNVSSLGTGTPVGLWDWDQPQGSGAAASGRCVSSAQDATTSGNYLANGGFNSWTTGGTPILNNWHLSTGVWGTSIQRQTGGIDGGFCVQFNAGATLNALTQQFGSSVSDGTLATAGTTAQPLPFRSFCSSVWFKADGVISGGVLTWEWVDGSGTVINDQAGTPNSGTVALTAFPTVWTNELISFRLPAIVPAITRLRFRISTALAGANLLMDAAGFAAPTNLYRGGPSLAVFSNPAAPFEANPEQDGWTVAFTNNRGGATFLATFQALVNRIWGAPDLLLPYSGTPNVADTLISNA